MSGEFQGLERLACCCSHFLVLCRIKVHELGRLHGCPQWQLMPCLVLSLPQGCQACWCLGPQLDTGCFNLRPQCMCLVACLARVNDRLTGPCAPAALCTPVRTVGGGRKWLRWCPAGAAPRHTTWPVCPQSCILRQPCWTSRGGSGLLTGTQTVGAWEGMPPGPVRGRCTRLPGPAGNAGTPPQDLAETTRNSHGEPPAPQKAPAYNSEIASTPPPPLSLLEDSQRTS